MRKRRILILTLIFGILFIYSVKASATSFTPINLKIDGKDCLGNPTGVIASPTLSWDEQSSTITSFVVILEDSNGNTISSPTTSSSEITFDSLEENTTYTVEVVPCDISSCYMGNSSSCTFTTGSGYKIPNPLSPTNDIPTLLEHIISFLFTLSLILGPVFIVIGALYLLISGGDINKVQRGKNIILYTVIGMAIIILAKVFVSLIKNIIAG